MNKTHSIRWLLVIFFILMLSACDLQEVTPPPDTAPPTITPFVILPTENVSPTVQPTSAPVEITSRNASALTVINRSAVTNIQELKWAGDNSSLLLSTQTFDATGAQSFGVTTLSVPDLQPRSIYSTLDSRVADISPDGSKIVLISLDQSALSVFDLQSDNSALFTLYPEYMIYNATFSPDSATLAVSGEEDTADGNANRIVYLYASADGHEIKTLSGFESAAPIFNAGFTEAPQWIVWHARATIQVQDIDSGAMGPALNHQDFVTAYASSWDGSMLASIASKVINDVAVPTISMWDAVQGEELKTLELTTPALCLDFSPNGALLAVGAGNNLEIWDVSTGAMIVSLEGHADAVTHLAFSDDGKYIATAGMDNQLYLWQVVE